MPLDIPSHFRLNCIILNFILNTFKGVFKVFKLEPLKSLHFYRSLFLTMDFDEIDNTCGF